MRSPVRRVASIRSLAVAAAVVGVLLGLLGMHVLGLHGVQHEAATGAGAVAQSHDRDASDAYEGSAHAAAKADQSAVAECCDHGHGMDGLMLCLALLVVAGILLLLASHGRAAGRPGSRRGSSSRTPRRATHARAGPPYLIAYSVIRC